MNWTRKPRLLLNVSLVVGLVLASYNLVYLWLSANGRYEPESIGLNGIKTYAWAPKGFVKEYRWDKTRLRVFAPVWFLDLKFWHTHGAIDSGNYPINEVADADLGIVWKAWTREANKPEEALAGGQVKK